ncbi:MAG: hypothetical protein NVSMB38_27750 [Ktedonobacteraceae bacterium]
MPRLICQPRHFLSTHTPHEMSFNIGQRLYKAVTGHLNRAAAMGKRLWGIQRQHDAASMVLMYLLL